MNNYGRKLVKPLLLGGAIAVGFAMNSTAADAAEINDCGPLSEACESYDDICESCETEACVTEDSKKLSDIESEMHTLQNAAEITEGDAVAENGYYEAAKKAVDNDSLTTDQADEFVSGGNAVLNQAEEKAGKAQEAYDEISHYATELEEHFKNSLRDEAIGLGEYADRLEATSDLQEKIDIAYESYRARQAKEEKLWEEHCALLDEEVSGSHRSMEAQAAYDQAEKEYLELQRQYSELQAELDKFTSEVDVNLLKEQTESYDGQLQELNQLRAEYEKCCAKFDEVYYSRATYETSVNSAAAEREAALRKLREGVAQGVSDDELSAQILACTDLLEAYNEAVKNLENWYSELDNALTERQNAKALYENHNDYLKKYEDDILGKYNFYLDLSKRFNDVQIAEQESAEKLCSCRNELNNASENESNIRSRIQVSTEKNSRMHSQSFSNDSIRIRYGIILDNLRTAGYFKEQVDFNYQITKDTNAQLVTLVNDYFESKAIAENLNNLVEEMEEATDDYKYADTPEELRSISEDIKRNSEKFSNVTEALGHQFTKEAEALGYGEYVERINSAKNDSERAKILDELTSLLEQAAEEASGHTVDDSEEFYQILTEIAESENKLEEARAEYNSALAPLVDDEGYLMDYQDVPALVHQLEKEFAKKQNQLDRRLDRIHREGIYGFTEAEIANYETIFQEECDAEARVNELYFGLGNGISEEKLNSFIDAYIKWQECKLRAEKMNYLLKEGMTAVSADEEIYTEQYTLNREYSEQIEFLNNGYCGSEFEKYDQASANYDEAKEEYKRLKQKRNIYLLNSMLPGCGKLLVLADEYKEALSLSAEVEALTNKANKIGAENALENVSYSTNYTFYEYYMDKPIKVDVTISANKDVLAKNVKEINSIDEFVKLSENKSEGIVTVTISYEDYVISSISKEVSMNNK